MASPPFGNGGPPRSHDRKAFATAVMAALQGFASEDGETEAHDGGMRDQTADLEPDPSSDLDTEHNPLLAFLTKGSQKQKKFGAVDSADMRKFLSSSHGKAPTGLGKPKGSVGFKGSRDVSAANLIYRVSEHRRRDTGALVDRGANGGVAGANVRVMQLYSDGRTVDIQGVDNHQTNNVPLGTIGGVITTQHGPVIAVFHQYAVTGRGNTIHSCGQMEVYGSEVNDRSLRVKGGRQCIRTPDGYLIPLNVYNGLPYMNIRPYTDHELATLPQVIMTGEDDWDPTVLDCALEDEDLWFDTLEDISDEPGFGPFDQYGRFKKREIAVLDALKGPPFLDTYMEEQFAAVDKVYKVNCAPSRLATQRSGRMNQSTSPIGLCSHGC